MIAFFYWERMQINKKQLRFSLINTILPLMEMEIISKYVDEHSILVIFGMFALVVIAIIALITKVGMTKTSDQSKRLPKSMRDRVNLLLKQASVALPQASDYPGMLGAKGASMVSDIQRKLEYIRSIAEISDGEVTCSKVTSEMNAIEFQQTVVDCDKKLKEFSRMLVEASKKASDIHLPKAYKEKRTIASLNEVGLIEADDSF
jgi:sensor c-di-GMP phosphodiesterase-like protein